MKSEPYGCLDVNCPNCGEEATKLKLRLTSNREFMDMARTMAANIVSEAMNAQGVLGMPGSLEFVSDILEGRRDENSTIEGILNSFMVFLQMRHTPMEVFLTNLAAVREQDGLKAKATAIMERQRKDDIGDLLGAIFGRMR